MPPRGAARYCVRTGHGRELPEMHKPVSDLASAVQLCIHFSEVKRQPDRISCWGYNRRHPTRIADAEAVRHLPRAPRLVPPAVRGTRPPRHPVTSASTRGPTSTTRPKASRRTRCVFNRMSPSAYLRGGVQGMFFTLELPGPPGAPRRAGRERAERRSRSRRRRPGNSRCSNRSACRTRRRASSTTRRKRSKPRTGLRFPVVVKANIGGSGAGIVRFDTPDDLAPRRRARTGSISASITPRSCRSSSPPAAGTSPASRLLGGKYLYAIKVFTTGESFNLCPADICQRADGVELHAQRLPDRRAEDRPEGRRLHARRRR